MTLMSIWCRCRTRLATLLKQILVDNQSIAYRHMAMDSLAEACLHNTQDELIARYQKHAVPTATEAARDRAGRRPGVDAGEIDAVAVNTCTGYLCPGLTSYVAEELGLRKDVRPFDLQGMGCGGAIPCLETGYNYLQAHPDRNVLTLSVEMCTATIFFYGGPGHPRVELDLRRRGRGHGADQSPGAQGGLRLTQLRVGPLPRVPAPPAVHDARTRS